GEGHALHQLEPLPGTSVVQDLRLLVEASPDAVPAELAYHAVAVGLRVTLHGVADIAQRGARTHGVDALPHRLVGDVAQALRLHRGLARIEHAAGIAVPAVLDHGDVDVHDVAVAQHLVAGHAVADLVVHRGADRLGVGTMAGRRIVQRRGDRVLHLDHVVVAQLVEVARRDAGLHVGRDEVEDLGGELARHPHSLDLLGRLHLVRARRAAAVHHHPRDYTVRSCASAGVPDGSPADGNI